MPHKPHKKSFHQYRNSARGKKRRAPGGTPPAFANELAEEALLEDQLEGQLQVAVFGSRAAKEVVVKVGAFLGADKLRSRCIRIGIYNVQVGVIERVVRLRPELQSDTLRYIEILK